MQSLQVELLSKMQRLDKLVEDMRNSGTQYAENERNYRVALRLAILEERHKGTPATITGDLCRGREDIAEMRARRDCAEAIYKSSQEAINVTKLQVRIIEGQIQREWGQGGIYEH